MATTPKTNTVYVIEWTMVGPEPTIHIQQRNYAWWDPYEDKWQLMFVGGYIDRDQAKVIRRAWRPLRRLPRF
jgi:hypothetical protein